MKKCTKCNQELELKMFCKKPNTKDGLNYNCNNCTKLYSQKYRQDNTNKIKEYYLNNISNYQEYYKNNSDKLKNYQKEYFKNNPDRQYNYIKKRKETDPLFRFKLSARRLIGNSFKRTLKGIYKKGKKTEEILGCTLEELIIHIQSQFTEGMTLENYSEWEIDHKIPISSAKTEEEIIKLNHYSNLQPLWRSDNRSKGSKVSIY
jgi:hypothetical protein